MLAVSTLRASPDEYAEPRYRALIRPARGPSRRRFHGVHCPNPEFVGGCMSVLLGRVCTVSVLAGLAAWVTFAYSAEQPPTPVGVDPVRVEAMHQTIPVIGRLVPVQSGIVAARVAGPVDRLVVDVGDHVNRGDAIVELDLSRLEARRNLAAAEISEFEAGLATAVATENLARRELRRLERLRNSAAFAESLYDTRVQELAVAKSRIMEAEARVARAQVSLRLAEIELQDGVVRAPYEGTVTIRHTNEGAWLRVGDPVVTLIDDVNLEIEADVPAERLGGIQPGVEVTIALDDGSRHTAVVRALVPDESQAARTRAVRFEPRFGDALTPMAANQTVSLNLPAGAARDVVSVHKDAVIRKSGQAFVFVVRDGLADIRSVELGEAVGGRFIVLKGLQPGDLVVIRGNERLRGGQPVAYPEQSDAGAEHDSFRGSHGNL